MLIHTRGEVIECQPKRGAKSAPSVLWLKLSIPMDALGDAEIAKLSRFLHGPTIGLTLDVGGPFVASDTGKSGRGRQVTIDDVAPPTASRRPERVTPLPDEKCQRCFERIGDDPDRRMYAPLVGLPQPMHGRCADLSDAERDQAAVDAADAFIPAEPPAEDAAPIGVPTEPGRVEEIEVGGAEPAPGTMQPTAGSDVDLIHDGPESIERLAPGWVPVPTELPAAVGAVGAEGEALEEWPATTDPRPSRVADPEAAAALGDLPPHLERVAASTDQTFEQLVGPSAATRKRRTKVSAGG